MWVGLSCYAPAKTKNFYKDVINRQAMGAKVHSQKGNSPQSMYRSLNKNFVETKVYVNKYIHKAKTPPR